MFKIIKNNLYIFYKISNNIYKFFKNIDEIVEINIRKIKRWNANYKVNSQRSSGHRRWKSLDWKTIPLGIFLNYLNNK